MTELCALSAIRAHFASGSISPEALWCAYVTIGGSYSVFELDAAIHEVLILAPVDHVNLGHALWELENIRMRPGRQRPERVLTRAMSPLLRVRDPTEVADSRSTLLPVGYYLA